MLRGSYSLDGDDQLLLPLLPSAILFFPTPTPTKLPNRARPQKVRAVRITVRALASRRLSEGQPQAHG